MEIEEAIGVLKSIHENQQVTPELADAAAKRVKDHVASLNLLVIAVGAQPAPDYQAAFEVKPTEREPKHWLALGAFAYKHRPIGE